MTAAVRDAIRDYLGAQMVLDGVIVVEVLHDGEPDPVLHRLRIGDLAPWTQLGMLRAAELVVEDNLRAGWEPDESED